MFPVSVIPNAVPNPPSGATVTVVSGTELEVFFCPPSLSAGDVQSYLIQVWVCGWGCVGLLVWV